MLKILGYTLCSILFATCAQASSVPFQAYPVEKYDATAKVSAGKTRLKVSVSLADTTPDHSIRLGDVILCEEKTCFRPKTSTFIDAHNTSDGSATEIADVMVPNGTVTHVYFSDVSGAKIITGTAKLQIPLKLDGEFPAAEILVILSKTKSANVETYVPTFATSAFMDKESRSLFYNPKFSLKALLPFNSGISIPANALISPQIFSVAVRDAGKAHPAVDIFPYLNLLKAAELTTNPIREAATISNAIEAVAPVDDAVNGIAAPSKLKEKVGTAVKKTFLKTGNFQAAKAEPASISPMGICLGCDFGGVTPKFDCYAYFRDQLWMSGIMNLLNQSGVVSSDACTSVPPFVHIAVIKITDPRLKMAIPYVFDQGQGLRLLPMTNFIPSSSALINGFTWAGDSGTSDGQHGQAEGFVSSAKVALGTNAVGGGVQGSSSGTPAGNKLVFGYDYANNNNYVYWDENGTVAGYTRDVVISSSTSVIKNGNCTSDSLESRWSAIGVTGAVMVMISSTSDGTTTAKDLCAIYQAFGIKNAIRLDGGPSAALIVGGVHKNPLTGLYRLKYGPIRHIAYPLMFQKAGTAIPTPPPTRPPGGIEP